MLTKLIVTVPSFPYLHLKIEELPLASRRTKMNESSVSALLADRSYLIISSLTIANLLKSHIAAMTKGFHASEILQKSISGQIPFVSSTAPIHQELKLPNLVFVFAFACILGAGIAGMESVSVDVSIDCITAFDKYFPIVALL